MSFQWQNRHYFIKGINDKYKNRTGLYCFYVLVLFVIWSFIYDQIETAVYSAMGKKVVADSAFLSKESHEIIKITPKVGEG